MKVIANVDVSDLKLDIAQTKINEALYNSMVKMKEIAMRKVPVDMGGLKASIHIEPNTKNSKVYELKDGVEYGVFVEYGTKPHWVPIAPLKEWAKRHGGEEGFAYAMRQKIAKEGINAQPFFRPALKETKEIWIPYFLNKVLGDNK